MVSRGTKSKINSSWVLLHVSPLGEELEYMVIPDSPEKLYYSISEVSEITGLEPYVLRFWEAEFPVLKPRKNKKGHRTYRKKDIEQIFQIKGLLYEHKYTIPGAREVLAGRKPSLSGKTAAPASTPCPTANPVSAGSDDTELLESIRRDLAALAAQLDKHRMEDIFAE